MNYYFSQIMDFFPFFNEMCVWRNVMCAAKEKMFLTSDWRNLRDQSDGHKEVTSVDF